MKIFWKVVKLWRVYIDDVVPVSITRHVAVIGAKFEEIGRVFYKRKQDAPDIESILSDGRRR